MSIKTHQVGAHRLSLFNNRISLSKGGFIQDTRDASSENFEAACTRLTEWYDQNGEDFLADLTFVDHILGR